MTAGVVVCAFGEPAAPSREALVDYLERIFHRNAAIESPASDEAARTRARQLAERRAPGLLAEYEAIGGSPMNAQAAALGEAVAATLADRGHPVEPYLGLQFVEPFVEDAVDAARADGVDRLVGLPLYPLCGPSTTVAALERLGAAVDAAVAETGWTATLDAVSGWHRHPSYPRLRADNVVSSAEANGLDLDDPATALVCSAHGTPISYLDAGSRYRDYVEEHVDQLAGALGLDDVVLGYQNHANRDVAWTEPAVQDALAGLDADRVVVEPVSFLHEQSETLYELDVELAETAADLGLDFFRVPLPTDDPSLVELLADLVEPLVAGDATGATAADRGATDLRPCECVPDGRTVCLNAPIGGAAR